MPAITLVQEQLFTTASPGTSWTVNMSTAFASGNMLLVALFTDATAVGTFSVEVPGSKGTAVSPAMLTTGSGVLQLFVIENLVSGTAVTARWSSGPTNAAMRVHECSPTLFGNSFFGSTVSSSTSAGPLTSTIPAANAVDSGIKYAALVVSVASTSQTQTGTDTWISYTITAGTVTAYYGWVLGCTATTSAYTWNLAGSGNYQTASAGSSTAAYVAPTIAARTSPRMPPGYKKRIIARERVPLVTPYGRDYPNGLDVPVVLGTRVVEGHVYNSSSVAVPGAAVKLIREFDDREVASTTTDSTGKYTFTRDSQDSFTYYVTAFSVVGGITQIHGTSDRGLVPQSDSSDQFTAILETEF